MSEQLIVLADVLVRATPLILAGLPAVVVASPSGDFGNIGADGQPRRSAAAAAAVGVTIAGTIGILAAPNHAAKWRNRGRTF